jgi:hypothetical protein
MLFFVRLDVAHPRNQNEKERDQKQQSATPSENLSHIDSPFLCVARCYLYGHI